MRRTTHAPRRDSPKIAGFSASGPRPLPSCRRSVASRSSRRATTSPSGTRRGKETGWRSLKGLSGGRLRPRLPEAASTDVALTLRHLRVGLSREACSCSGSAERPWWSALRSPHSRSPPPPRLPRSRRSRRSKNSLTGSGTTSSATVTVDAFNEGTTPRLPLRLREIRGDGDSGPMQVIAGERSPRGAERASRRVRVRPPVFDTIALTSRSVVSAGQSLGARVQVPPRARDEKPLTCGNRSGASSCKITGEHPRPRPAWTTGSVRWR